jgi:large subunit ribosomal protein L18
MKPRSKSEFRQRRHVRLRQRVRGTAERPRMCVFVSNRHLYVQFIDDDAQTTLAALNTQSEQLGAQGKSTVDVAKKLGAQSAQLALDKGIRQVVFDRGGFSYRGRIKVLADAAREAGLQF